MSFMKNINEPTSRVFNAIISVGTTAVQVPSFIDASWIQFTHEHASAKVYLGSDEDGDGNPQPLTTTNGWGALTLDDTTERYPVMNTDIFWLISDTAATDVRILWGK